MSANNSNEEIILREKAAKTHQLWNATQSILQLRTSTGLSVLGWLLQAHLGLLLSLALFC